MIYGSCTEAAEGSRPLNKAECRAVCDALFPLISRPDHADWRINNGRPPSYFYRARTLRWENVRSKLDLLPAVLDRFPEAPFALYQASSAPGRPHGLWRLRLLVNRDVPAWAWQVPSPLSAEQRRAAALRGVATRKAKQWSQRSALWRSRASELGWRVWLWDGEWLRSPYQVTLWPEDGILEAKEWSDEGALRGKGGIHATALPVDWRKASPRHHRELNLHFTSGLLVDGIVERFGRAVVGDEGWRAERVIIRKIRAPSTEVGLAIEARYPTVEVYYPE